MGKSDQERAYFIGELVIYLGLVAATVAVGGAIGWVLPGMVVGS